MFMEQNQIISFLKQKFPDLKQKRISYSRIGGLTNINFLISVDDQPEFVLKFLSEGFDRKRELLIMEMLAKLSLTSELKFGSQSLIVQKFLKNYLHPSIEQLNDLGVVEPILKKMHDFHEVKIKPVEHEDIFCHKIFSSQTMLEIKQLSNLANSHLSKLTQEINIIMSKVEFWKKKLIPKQKKSIKFCHNDLNNLNIMIKQGEVKFIDFEYASHNYLSFDIANFLNESCIDYRDAQFPQFHLVKTQQKSFIDKVCQIYPGYYENMEEEVVNMFSLANLYWAIWSLRMYQFHSKDSQFGVVEHGMMRIDLFYHYQQMANKFKKS